MSKDTRNWREDWKTKRAAFTTVRVDTSQRPGRWHWRLNGPQKSSWNVNDWHVTSGHVMLVMWKTIPWEIKTNEQDFHKSSSIQLRGSEHKNRLDPTLADNRNTRMKGKDSLWEVTKEFLDWKGDWIRTKAKTPPTPGITVYIPPLITCAFLSFAGGVRACARDL